MTKRLDGLMESNFKCHQELSSKAIAKYADGDVSEGIQN